MSRVSRARIGVSASVAAIAISCALMMGAPLLVAADVKTADVAPTATQKSADSVRVTTEQMQHLSIVPVETDRFRVQKPAIGQIAFNDDMSTLVLTPFSGRVTRLIARVGDDVKRGDPLFEIDSPEVVQAQTDLIAALHGLEKSKSQLALAKRVLDRQTSLLADKATAQREVDQARNDYAVAESDLATSQGTLMAARNKLRVIVGRDRNEVERVERERSVNPLITINAPIDGTVIARKVGPGQYVRSDVADSLYAISDLTTMWLKANVPESDIAHVRIGQEIEVKVTALPDRVFKARITAIGAASDAARHGALGNPQSGSLAEIGNVRELQDHGQRRRSRTSRPGRGRDPRRRTGDRVDRARADAVPPPQGEDRDRARRPRADSRRPERRRAGAWTRRDFRGQRVAHLMAPAGPRDAA